MAPQESIPLAANVLGTIGTNAGVFRIWHNWRRKSTEGLPSLMVMLWAVAAVPFGVYAIVQNFNFPLKLQPQCFGCLTLICWGQILFYHNHWRAWTATLAAVLVMVLFAVVELGLVFALRGPYRRGVSWPVTMIGIIGAVVIGVSLIPPYFELAKRKGRVIGINFIFLSVDWSGAFFSLLALVAQHTFDYVGGVMYIVCISLETGIFLSQFIWLWRTRKVRRDAKLAGKSYDEYIAENHSSALAMSGMPDGGNDTVKSSEPVKTITALPKCKTKPSKGSLNSVMTDVDLEKGHPTS